MAAITGHFVADFSKFDAAVKNATVELKHLETGSENVEKSLNSMVDRFSGRRLIQDANVMVEAIERLGGASALTEAELAKAGNKAAEAAAKMRALGMDVPAGLEKLAGAATKTTSAFDKMAVAAGTFLGNFAYDLGRQALSTLVEWGKQSFQMAGQIDDMSKKLGISTDVVQGFSFAAEQSGTTLEAIGAAVNKLNLNLGSEDKGAVKALKSLGLSFEDVRRMKPEDAFLAIADKIQAIQDPMERVRVGTELMGKGFVEILPAIDDGIRQMSDGAVKMSEETVKRLAAAEDAWGNSGGP